MSSTSLAWIYLVLSGVADVAWAVSTKFSNGYSRLSWTLVSIVALVVFLSLLTQALKTLPLGTAYAVWTGIGAVGSVLCGVLLFGETITVSRATAMLVIAGGVIALKIVPA
ncbi:MAG: multidrug efflux SMR transporter [Ensifer adhaerens]|jgi:quaternary ammonium compound-resistance protein SugE|nr:multidrug efflux SMR transporter [Ensifer adhaerens]